jgi:hypothetical protein
MSMIIDGTNGLTFNNATTQASAGQVLQVVNVAYATDTSSSSSVYSDTGLTASITPKFSTSKILILVSQNGLRKGAGDTRLGLQLLKNSTVLAVFETNATYTQTSGVLGVAGSSLCYLDSPATTSSISYKTQFRSVANVSNVSVQTDSSTSTITLMEIAA